ncbi:hypothetical protein K1719_035088 [Acacia pycnantha]|nr:hypothetical protein K1719_035088 [Acacia pycnantha]
MEGHKKILGKRRRFSALRDFPPGCGRFAAKLEQQTETCDDKKLSVMYHRSEEAGGGGSEIVGKRHKFYSVVHGYQQSNDPFEEEDPEEEEELVEVEEGIELEEAEVVEHEEEDVVEHEDEEVVEVEEEVAEVEVEDAVEEERFLFY